MTSSQGIHRLLLSHSTVNRRYPGSTALQRFTPGGEGDLHERFGMGGGEGAPMSHYYPDDDWGGHSRGGGGRHPAPHPRDDYRPRRRRGGEYRGGYRDDRDYYHRPPPPHYRHYSGDGGGYYHGEDNYTRHLPPPRRYDRRHGTPRKRYQGNKLNHAGHQDRYYRHKSLAERHEAALREHEDIKTEAEMLKQEALTLIPTLQVKVEEKLAAKEAAKAAWWNQETGAEDIHEAELEYRDSRRRYFKYRHRLYGAEHQRDTADNKIEVSEMWIRSHTSRAEHHRLVQRYHQEQARDAPDAPAPADAPPAEEVAEVTGGGVAPSDDSDDDSDVDDQVAKLDKDEGDLSDDDPDDSGDADDGAETRRDKGVPDERSRWQRWR